MSVLTSAEILQDAAFYQSQFQPAMRRFILALTAAEIDAKMLVSTFSNDAVKKDVLSNRKSIAIETDDFTNE